MIDDALSDFQRRQINAERSMSLLPVSLRVRVRAGIHTLVCLASNPAFHPTTPCALFELHSRFYGHFCYFCHFSEVHFLLPQLHKRPITPAGDLLPLIGFPMAEAPFQPVHGLLLSTQNRLPGGTGSLAAGHLSHQFLPSCQPKLLISDLSVIHNSPALTPTFACPSVHLRRLQVTMWQLKATSGRTETLSVRLTNWDVGKIPPRLISWRLHLNYLRRSGFLSLEETNDRGVCDKSGRGILNCESRSICKHQNISLNIVNEPSRNIISSILKCTFLNM